MSALLLAAVGGTGWETGVALTANHFFTVVLFGQKAERRLDGTTSQTQDKMEGRF